MSLDHAVMTEWQWIKLAIYYLLKKSPNARQLVKRQRTVQQNSQSPIEPASNLVNSPKQKHRFLQYYLPALESTSNWADYWHWPTGVWSNASVNWGWLKCTVWCANCSCTESVSINSKNKIDQSGSKKRMSLRRKISARNGQFAMIAHTHTLSVIQIDWKHTFGATRSSQSIIMRLSANGKRKRNSLLCNSAATSRGESNSSNHQYCHSSPFTPLHFTSFHH